MAHSKRTIKDDVYLPAITTKVSSLSSLKGALSQSCPYLYDKRRGSFSSVASQRSGTHPKKQVLSYLQKYSSKCTCASFQHEIFSSFCHPLSSRQSSLKAQKEAKKSNVTVTMVYLGQGRRGSGGLGLTRDELKVLQQVNGGENICVFKDLVTPGGRSGEHSKLFCKNGQECAQKRSKGGKKIKPFLPHLTEAQNNRMKWEVLNVLPLFTHLITSALEATL